MLCSKQTPLVTNAWQLLGLHPSQQLWSKVEMVQTVPSYSCFADSLKYDAVDVVHRSLKCLFYGKTPHGRTVKLFQTTVTIIMGYKGYMHRREADIQNKQLWPNSHGTQWRKLKSMGQQLTRAEQNLSRLTGQSTFSTLHVQAHGSLRIPSVWKVPW